MADQTIMTVLGPIAPEQLGVTDLDRILIKNPARGLSTAQAAHPGE